MICPWLWRYTDYFRKVKKIFSKIDRLSYFLRLRCFSMFPMSSLLTFFIGGKMKIKCLFLLFIFSLLSCNNPEEINDDSFSEKSNMEDVEKEKNIEGQNETLAENGAVQNKADLKQQRNFAIKVFFDDSFSMKGYTQNNTNLPYTMTNFISDLKNYGMRYSNLEKPEFYWVNNKPVPVKYDDVLSMPGIIKEHFQQTCNCQKDACSECLKKCGWKIGKKNNQKADKDSNDDCQARCDTKLNTIIKSVLDHTDENTISFLISDLIYSLPSEDDAEENIFYILQTQTSGLFKNKQYEFEDELAVTLIKLTQSFNGRYYRKDNTYVVCKEKEGKPSCPSCKEKKETDSCVERPLYILALSKKDLLNDFFAKNEPADMFNKDGQKQIFNNVANFAKSSEIIPEKCEYFLTQKERNYDADSGAKNIYGFDRDSEDQFSFSFAARINTDPIKSNEKDWEKYLLTGSNYEIDRNVVADIKIKKFEQEDYDKTWSNGLLQKMMENLKPTHTFIVTVKNLPPDNKITLSLKASKHEIGDLSWVDESSNDNDMVAGQPDKKTTFGFKYLVGGIKGAFREKGREGADENSRYFSIEIGIKQ